MDFLAGTLMHLINETAEKIENYLNYFFSGREISILKESEILYQISIGSNWLLMTLVKKNLYFK